ncbi:MAG TPA: hypothetical protein DEG43_16545 [Acidimicrobiaceae bacterium]|nr:hypothetical protein [Acidimicrobiaceae bacterium]
MESVGTESHVETQPQRSLKYTAVPEGLWRAGAYFVPSILKKRQSHHHSAGLPAPGLSWSSLAAVVADEVVLAGFKITRDPPTTEAWKRIATEVNDALGCFADNGWIEDPAAYHRSPSVPTDVVSTPLTRWEALGLPWEQLRWSSDWLPHPDEPGHDRWASYERNTRGSAFVLRHRDNKARHWALVLHGTEQGRLLVDQKVFRARHLFQELGCNVIMPLLPLHASRRSLDGEGTGFPTLDVLDNIHGIAQSVFDTRSILAWIRQQNPVGISVTGLSLGGNIAAVVAGLEEPLGAVVGLVPAVDFPELFRRQSPKAMRNSDAFSTLHTASKQLHQVVSPLSFSPATPPNRLFLLAGLHDRLLDPVVQAGRLASHWNTTNVHWVERGHVTHMSGAQLGAVIDEAVEAAVAHHVEATARDQTAT